MFHRFTFRVSAIEIRVTWSVLIVVTLIAATVADSVLPEWAEGRSTAAYWTLGAGTAVAFIAGLAAHELGHAVVARRYGLGVGDITLWLFGGVATMKERPASPQVAARVAIAGPIVSAVLAMAAAVAGVVVGGLIGAALSWFALMNLALVGFNLLPAFPLDGGRLYQAWRWRRTGNELRATEDAVGAGLAIGAVLVTFGVIEALFASLLGGLWIICIGWFIREAARAELDALTVDSTLAAIPVRDVMSPNPLTVDPHISIDEFVAGVFFGGRHGAYPVVDGDAVVGLVSLNAVRSVPADKRASARIAEVMVPLDQLLVTLPGAPVSDLFGDLGSGPTRRALVLEAGSVVGIVSPSDISRLVTVLEVAPHQRRSASSPLHTS